MCPTAALRANSLTTPTSLRLSPLLNQEGEFKCKQPHTPAFGHSPEGKCAVGAVRVRDRSGKPPAQSCGINSVRFCERSLPAETAG